MHLSGSTIAADPLVCMSLPPSKHRWVTAAILLCSPSPLDSANSSAAISSVITAGEDSSLPHHWLVCGDRKGSLHVYQTNLSTKTNKVYIYSIMIVSFKTFFLMSSLTVYAADAVTAWCPRFQWSNPHHSD